MTIKSAKRALFLSLVSLVLCIAMLLGTTYAWFTDTASNTGNRIKSGILKVDLLKYDTEKENADEYGYYSIKNGQGDIFGKATSSTANANETDTLWEPGKTQVVFLAVENIGTLALKYNIRVIITDITNAESGKSLAEAFEYAILDGAMGGDYEDLSGYSWTAIKGADGAQTGDFALGTTIAAPNGHITDKGGRDYFALAVHMKEDSGNEYQTLALSVDVNVVATQYTYEEDSFDDQYDKDSPFPTIADGYKITTNYDDDLQDSMKASYFVNGVELELDESGSPIDAIPAGTVVYVTVSSIDPSVLTPSNIDILFGDTALTRYEDADLTDAYDPDDSTQSAYFMMPDGNVTVNIIEDFCIAEGTLITLADGTQKAVEDIVDTDKLLVWNMFTGSYDEQSAVFIFSHGKDNYRITNLEFDDGSVLRIIGDHGVFDYDLNRFVYLCANNYSEYVGHRFVKAAGEGYDLVTLTGAQVTTEYTGAYTIVSASSLNVFASGILTLTPPEVIFNWIEMGDTLRYDVEAFENDLATYGTYDYEVFAEYGTYEQFAAFNAAYLKIPVEKGYFTFDQIIAYIERFIH